MLIVLLIAVGTLFIVWIVTGVRLMRLARKTRAWPEFILGLALLLQAGLGYPLSVIAQFTGQWMMPLTLLASIFTNVGMGLLFVFTARVFHDSARWAWAVVGAAGALIVVQTVGHAMGQATVDPAERLRGLLFWGAGSLALSGLSWGWTAFEALRFHRLLRKRVALGLGDPTVANRMMLWGAMGAIAFSCVVIDAMLLYSGSDFARNVVLPFVTAVAGLLVSVCMILAFWPPAAYLEFIRGSQERART